MLILGFFTSDLFYAVTKLSSVNITCPLILTGCNTSNVPLERTLAFQFSGLLTVCLKSHSVVPTEFWHFFIFPRVLFPFLCLMVIFLDRHTYTLLIVQHVSPSEDKMKPFQNVCAL